METLRIFKLLLSKNFLVRKRHWKMGLFVEIIIPFLLFLLIQSSRDFSADPLEHILENTTHEIITKNDLLQKFSITTTIFYVPITNFTTSIVEKMRVCLRLPKDS